jgi:transposase
MEMKVKNLHAAGIDVGSKSHFVAVGQGDDEIKEFGVSHSSHQEIICYLRYFGIETVAMESTGNYWQCLSLALTQAGFKVLLVPGTQTKAFRKTDVKDARQLQLLHSLGGLSSCYIPDEFTSKVRELTRHRKSMIQECSKHINKMQKCLRLMNIRLDVVLSDVVGVSGLKIIQAILQGERDPHKLAALANRRVRKTKEQIADALVGNFSQEHLYELKDCFEIYEFIQTKIQDVDNELSRYYTEYQGEIQTNEEVQLAKKQLKGKNQPKFSVQQIAYKMYGVDISAINGVSVNTILTFMSEVGTSIYKFPDAKSFTSWLCLCPNNKISGGKKLSGRTPKGKNTLALALRDATNVIGNQKQGYLSSFFKKIGLKKGRFTAITATARKLAVIIYNMITKKEEYSEQKNEMYRNNLREKQLAKAIKMLKNNNFQVVDFEGVVV